MVVMMRLRMRNRCVRKATSYTYSSCLTVNDDKLPLVELRDAARYRNHGHLVEQINQNPWPITQKQCLYFSHSDVLLTLGLPSDATQIPLDLKNGPRLEEFSRRDEKQSKSSYNHVICFVVL